MLAEYTVKERAITWYAIAVLSNLEGNHETGSFCKASAYLDVLNIPWNKCNGPCNRESFQEYATGLALDYVDLNDILGYDNFNQYLKDTIDPEFYKVVKA